MSENKFIKHLRGEQTAKSVLELKNQRAKTSFANMPNGTSNGDVVYSDHRGNATAVLKGTDNWKLNGSSLVVPTEVYGDGRDVTGTYDVAGQTLWVDASYTFPQAKIFTPNTKWVLKLCGNRLLSGTDDTIPLTLLIKFGATIIATKAFTIKEHAFNFSEELVVDFAESNTNNIKVAANSTMTVQVLCGDATATAQIYNGMTVFTALQRRVDGDTVASDEKTFDDVVDDVEQLQEDLDDLEEYVDETFVKKAGDTMSGALNIANIASSNTPLLTLTHSSTATYKWNIAPRYNSTTLSVYPGSTETNGFRFATTGFVPASNNARYLGSASLKWKGVYTGALNNGADIIVPNKSGTLATMSDVELAANSGSQLYTTGVWYAKMDPNTTVPSYAEVTGRNYADFSDGHTIFIYEYDGATWQEIAKITPPAEYNGYIWVTSKIWDIPEQTNQQGGEILWDHTHETFTPYPRIVDVDLTNYLQNTATGTNSLTILGDATPASTALNIGPYSTAEGTNSLAIGPGSGNAHRVRATHANAIAIGYDALALAIDAIQLGTGQGTTQGRFRVWNYTMLDKTTGKIPIARLGDDTSMTQGNVLTLDSNGAAVWQAPSGGGSAGQAIDAEIIGGVVVNGSEVSNLGTGGGRGHLILPGSFNLDATTFEVGVAFTTSNQSGNIGVIKGVCTNDGSVKYPTGVSMGMTSVGNFIAVVYTDINDPLAPTIMISGGTAVSSTKYYLKLVYDHNDASTPYKLSVSTDGTTYTVIGQSSTNVPPSNPTQYTIGKTGEKLTSVDMSGCYIKRNGIIIWQGMDAPGLPQRAAKGHEVIEFEAPTAQNNYTWYRKYADGWVEQGGNVTATSDASYNVALPVTMANNKYTVFVTRDNGSQDHGEGSINARWCEVWSRTTSSFYTWGIYGDSTDFSWQVSGMAA